MNSREAVFVGLVAVSLVLGGVTALDFGDRLGDIDTATDIEGEMTVNLANAAVEDDRFVATVRIHNPTDSTVVLQNAGLRIHNDSVQRIAAGPGRRLDDGPSEVGPGDTVEATFGLRLSDDGQQRVQSALGRDARLSMNIGMRYRSTEFDVIASDLPAAESGGET